jgi:hypothetical protein
LYINNVKEEEEEDIYFPFGTDTTKQGWRW